MAKKSLCAWQDLALGAAILAPGSAAKLKTGDWRTLIPRLDEEDRKSTRLNSSHRT